MKWHIDEQCFKDWSQSTKGLTLPSSIYMVEYSIVYTYSTEYMKPFWFKEVSKSVLNSYLPFSVLILWLLCDIFSRFHFYSNVERTVCKQTMKPLIRRHDMYCFFFVWFDSLRPINNISVKQGRVFLGWTSTKLGLMFLLKDHNAVTPVRL